MVVLMPPVSNETLLRYCETVYDHLASTAKKNKEHGFLWEGKIVESFHACGISNAFYGKIMNTMYEIGCLKQVRRGARGVLTQIALLKRPTATDLENAHGLESHLTKPTEYDRLSQRVSSVEGRLQGIELARVVANFDARLRTLEAKVKESA
jgi:hypothetical protein